MGLGGTHATPGWQSECPTYRLGPGPIAQGLATFLCKGPDSRYFQLCGPHTHSQNFPTLPSEREAVTDDAERKGCGCVPIKLYTQQHLNFVQFSCVQNTLLLLTFFNNHLRMHKPFSARQPNKKGGPRALGNEHGQSRVSRRPLAAGQKTGSTDLGPGPGLPLTVLQCLSVHLLQLPS